MNSKLTLLKLQKTLLYWTKTGFKVHNFRHRGNFLPNLVAMRVTGTSENDGQTDIFLYFYR